MKKSRPKNQRNFVVCIPIDEPNGSVILVALGELIMEPRIRELAREARAVVSNADMYLAFLKEEKPPAEITEKAVKVAKANTQAALAFLEDLLRLCDYPRWTASTK